MFFFCISLFFQPRSGVDMVAVGRTHGMGYLFSILPTA